MTRILFVCMGNICRSPMAEVVVRVMAGRAGLSSVLEVGSAGTHTDYEGELPDQRARNVAIRRGYDLSRFRARQVTGQHFVLYDRILAMDYQNLSFLQRASPAEHLSKLSLFLDYAVGAAGCQIADPYYGGVDGFEEVLDLCELGAQGLIQSIVRNGALETSWPAFTPGVIVRSRL